MSGPIPLLNPNGATNTAGWTAVTGTLKQGVINSPDNGFTSTGGTATTMFYCTSPVGQFYQDVVLPAGSDAGNMSYDMSYWRGRYATTASSGLKIEVFDSSAVSLGVIHNVNASTEPNLYWYKEEVQGVFPVGAHSIRVTQQYAVDAWITINTSSWFAYVPGEVDAKVSALEMQVLYDPGPVDLKASALEMQVLYSASRVEFGGFEVTTALTTPAVAHYGGFEVLIAVSKVQAEPPEPPEITDGMFVKFFSFC